MASLPTSFPGWWPDLVKGSSLGAEAWKPSGLEFAVASTLREAIFDLVEGWFWFGVRVGDLLCDCERGLMRRGEGKGG
jgi:hypothetical protein